ncbi:hypothetical protein FHR24_000941 [Wenyingzhuangia heitensis]|uniref:DUF985 domain-containing protein n=1 Tax=Wenyingzhuangia heitensis TaxID=1487859 RepID=A0ABX0U6T5_9FLAO|nr:cupin domain-containing protein [Wenyingzhuangia heitensis]NIJ44502.1 hypothetical protein [Wenyingzhuangia heitensis]
MNRADLLIKELNLSEHPEGGYFKETYRSDGIIISHHLSMEFNGNRAYGTSIYFLLKSNSFSAFHKINQDEIWHFHEGSPVRIHQISPRGEYTSVVLGSDVLNKQQFQHVVPANYWFGATVENKDNYTLVGCTVSPGFDFDDFTLAKRAELISLFPEHQEIISTLTNS